MNTHNTLIIFLICNLILAFGCQNMNTNNDQNNAIHDSNDYSQYKAGSICTIEDGANKFGVVKVLVVEDGAVHVRIYKNKFDTRPDKIDLSTLSLGSINDPGGFGVGHVPLGKVGFENWKPVVVDFIEVKKDELEGYQLWKNH